MGRVGELGIWTFLRTMMKITKKKVAVELRFCGNGRVIEVRPGSFRGGLPDATSHVSLDGIYALAK